MIRENQQLLNQFNVLTDAVAVFLAMLVSYWLRFGLFRGIKGMPFNYYVWLGVVAAALTLVVFAVAGLYESFRAVRFHVEAGRVVVLELLVALIVMAAMFVLRLGETSRWSVAFFYGVSVLLLVGKRAALRLLLHHYRAMGFNQKRVLLVGHGESAEAYVKRDIRCWDMWRTTASGRCSPTVVHTTNWRRYSSGKSRMRWWWPCPQRRGAG